MEKILNKIKGCSRNQILILMLTGMLLVIIGIPVQEKQTETQQTNTELTLPEQTKEEQLERRLEEILSQVSGIGKTKVMISLESDGQRIVEKDLEYTEGKEENAGENDTVISTQNSRTENTVYEKDVQGNEKPYITEELAPEITGVLVIAQGAGNAGIKTEITEAVMALFGVEAHKIKVMKMN